MSSNHPNGTWQGNPFRNNAGHDRWNSSPNSTPNPWAWKGCFSHGGRNNQYYWNNNSGNTTSTNCGNTSSENCCNTNTYNNSGNKITRTGNISSNGGGATTGGNVNYKKASGHSSATLESASGGSGGSISIGG
ncbi:hypothetical protein ANOM_000395 [Aspergillus nomiae NRRL 13137]|uniref:Uncharacterized protein n=1 Tax=Aspergillus nomiae NRRL (strain ATCC 15546 / NRRL 13137 / CBS 260.88 / M93) TaxID=1509407 RepID=A0A0L1JHP3_ASPN3|nr:uncharacterized protein ANOM_000395 [Aspergillus nomiae NRRL 13137]KNG91222.1 hypothetical protein ANOM_000395 [Aspergillus nomiae NRRL 13137]